MRSFPTTLLIVFLATGLVAGALTVPRADAQEPAAGQDDQVFYALGLLMAQNLGQFDLTDKELAQVIKGLEDGVLKREPKVDVGQYMPKIQALAGERTAKAAAVEAEAATAFLAQKAEEEGAVRTDSGLIYKEIVPGTGGSPAATDQVKVHYHGTLRTGEVFDSSVARGEPVTFPLNRVIPCWTEGVQKMKVGGKSQLVCPAAIAYGDRGAGKIPPGAALVFEVELLDVVTAAPEPAKPEPEGQ